MRPCLFRHTCFWCKYQMRNVRGVQLSYVLLGVLVADSPPALAGVSWERASAPTLGLGTSHPALVPGSRELGTRIRSRRNTWRNLERLLRTLLCPWPPVSIPGAISRLLWLPADALTASKPDPERRNLAAPRSDLLPGMGHPWRRNPPMTGAIYVYKYA